MKWRQYFLGSSLSVMSATSCAAEMRNPLSGHVLNLQTGVPTAGIEVELDRKQGEEWIRLSQGTTDGQGRITALYPSDQKAQTGVYRVIFKTGDFYKKNAQPTFFPEIPVMFSVTSTDQHYHIPLLLSQYGYSTYRGN